MVLAIGWHAQSPGLPRPAPLTHLHDKIVTEWRTTLMTAVPSGLYVALNNLIFVAIAELSTPVFLVSYQFKLITTAGFSVYG